MTNLLPVERRQALIRDYVLRLGVVILSFASALAIIAAVLLVPTYVLLQKNISAKQVRLASIQSSLSSADEATLSARLAVLSNYANTLDALGNVPSPTALLRDVLAVSRPGITISTFSYAPPVKIQYKNTTSTKAGTLALSGTATTRDALRNYQLAIQSASFAQSANLPVSAYAQDTNISFTITVTLTP